MMAKVHSYLERCCHYTLSVCWQSQPAKDPHLLRLFRFLFFTQQSLILTRFSTFLVTPIILLPYFLVYRCTSSCKRPRHGFSPTAIPPVVLAV